MLSQRWNRFLECSASDEMHSAYAQHILKDDFEMGCDFLLCWACAKIGYSLAENAQKLVTLWLSMRWKSLLVGWACAKIGYSQAEHTRKSFRRTACIFYSLFKANAYHLGKNLAAGSLLKTYVTIFSIPDPWGFATDPDPLFFSVFKMKKVYIQINLQR